MNFSQQLKTYREINMLSQDELASKIYVTRQTISKWENDKSYPDIHNLVALSILFEISLDELVKGDLTKMNNVVLKSKWNFWLGNLFIFSILTPLSFGPAMKFWGLTGLILPVGLIIWLMVVAYKFYTLQQQNNLRTYIEILAFIEQKQRPNQQLVKEELTTISQQRWLVMVGAVLFFILLLVISFLIVY